MRNFKFLATAIVAVMLTCVLAVASFAAVTPFTDVDDKNNEALSDAVVLLEGIGVTKGTSATTFGTMEHVTRQQMAAFVYRLFRPDAKDVEGLANSTPFTDLSDSTYYGYIDWASSKGIIKGTSATTFDPTGGIMLQDAYTMLVRALGHETEEYVYPFTYIDKAEELGLDEDLDSAVGYTTKLTRGDVAVILYNTFFAETSKTSNSKYFRESEADLYEFVKVQKALSLAEDVYEVHTGEFMVRATPRYAFNDNVNADDYSPLCYDFEEEMLQFVAMDDEEPIAEFYYEFSESGLSGSADDYIMNEMEVFYTYVVENDQRKIDKVYLINGKKSVLETTSATGYWISNPDTNEEFYVPHDAYPSHALKYEKVEGYITVNNETIYFFDAPYSYLKPNYNSIDYEGIKAAYGNDASMIIEGLKYSLRNENNVKLIDIKAIDFEDGTYSYYLNADRAPVDSAEDLLYNLQRIYSNGVYTLKFFDINYDGIYDYAQYMPATYGFMDGNPKKYFSSDMKGNAPIQIENKGSDLDAAYVPTIYYNEANITGAKFEDGDFVVAYLNPEANMINVVSVVKPYNGYVNSLRYSSGLIKIDGQSFQSACAYRVVENFWDGDTSTYWTYGGKTYTYFDYYNEPSLYYLKNESWRAQIFPNLINKESTAEGEIFDVYAYKLPGAYNQILWYDHLEDATMTFDMDELAIPVSDKKTPGETYTEFEFDDKLGEKVHYANLYYNGKISYQPLNTDDMFPSLGEGATNRRYNLSLIEGYEKDNGYVAVNRAYVDKVCKVKIDENNHITLVPVLHAEDEDGVYSGVSRNSAILTEEGNRRLYGNDLSYERRGVIKKVAGSRFALTDIDDGTTLLGDVFGNGGDQKIKYFEMNAATRIIIKNTIETDIDDLGNEYVKEFEYLEFNSTNFKSSTSKDTPLTNIQYVLRADPDSTTKATLVLLYAEAENFEFEVKSAEQSWRIVTDSYVRKDDEKEFRNYYRLFNPFTGAIEEDVAGYEHEDKASAIEDAVEDGVVVKLKNGIVNENGEIAGRIDTADSTTGLVYITEYDDTFEYIGIVPVEAMDEAVEAENSAACCGEEFKAVVEDFVYNGAERNFIFDENGRPERFATTVDANLRPIDGNKIFYQITDDTVITVLTSKEAGNEFLSSADFKLADITAIAEDKKEFKCYNSDVLDKKGNVTTGYADYIKAYVYADEVRDEDVIPEASLIIIVVNGNEERIYTDYDDSFPKKSHDKHN